VSAARDPYSVLGVPAGADDETIKRAFRRLVREHHPDRSPAPGADARFREIVEAYEQLAVPRRRRREPRGDVSAIVSFYAWLAGRHARTTAESAGDSAPPVAEDAPEPPAPPARAERAVQLAAVAMLVYAVSLLALVLSR
jgi:hypothetical protein